MKDFLIGRGAHRRATSVYRLAAFTESDGEPPDGRATFKLVTINGETAIEWHRIGTHSIYDEPE